MRKNSLVFYTNKITQTIDTIPALFFAYTSINKPRHFCTSTRILERSTNKITIMFKKRDAPNSTLPPLRLSLSLCQAIRLAK